MLTLKKYRAISALALAIVGQMNAMNEEEQVKAYIKEAQTAYQTGFHITKNFQNVVCDGDKALATNATSAIHYTASSVLPTTEFEIRKNGEVYAPRTTYKLGSCAAYFQTMVSIQNTDHIRNQVNRSCNERDLLNGDTKSMDNLVSSNLKGSLVHMIINGNTEKRVENKK